MPRETKSLLPMLDLNRAEKIRKFSTIYFAILTGLYFLFAFFKFGSWNFSNSDSWLRISEVLFMTISVHQSWRAVIRILLILQIILVIYIFAGDHGMKFVNTISLVVLFFVDCSQIYFVKK
jgi:hypothetical protein